MFKVNVNIKLITNKNTNFSFFIDEYNIYESISRDIINDEIIKKNLNISDIESLWFDVGIKK